MITLTWAPIVGSDVASYRVYRSILGVVLVKAQIPTGAQMTLAIDEGASQVVTFGADPVATFNTQVSTARAYLSADGLAVYLRPNNRLSGSIEILDGSEVGTTNRLVTSQSEVILLASVDALEDESQALTYEDADGTFDDFYALSTVDSDDLESTPTALSLPESPNGALCRIEGMIIDIQGQPVVDVKITATLLGTPDPVNAKTYITTKSVETLSNPDGTFSLSLLQGSIVRFQIPDVEYDQNVIVPNRSFAVWTELQVDTDYRPELG